MTTVKLMALAFEENSQGVTEAELERTFYAELPPDVVRTASRYEDHEQWQLQLPNAINGARARMRVRRTQPSQGPVKLEQTIKTDLPGSEPGNTKVAETTISITQDVFDQIKALSKDGMKKRRIFMRSIDGHELQIDAFPSADGFNSRVKVDYEYSGNMPSRPKFPDIFTDIIDGDTQEQSQKDMIRSWYSTIFSVSAEPAKTTA